MPKEKPLLTQYRQIKAENEGCILMFLLGGFFMVFHEDAYIASQVLGLKIIKRNIGDGKVPACGVPKASVSKHAKSLAENGYSVAICNQGTEDSKTPGVIQRVVTEVIVPDENIPKADPVNEEDYLEFLKTFEAEIKKQDKEKKPPSKEICVRPSEILKELQTLDLEQTSPQTAWAILYHWKRTYCDENDGL